jgi:hypothetical protein
MIAFLALTAFGFASVAIYLLPLVLGIVRRAPDIAVIAILNVLLGWTFAGWVAALALALRSLQPPAPTVQVVQQLPYNPWPTVMQRPPWEAPPLMLPPAITGEPGSEWVEGDGA